MNAASGGSFEAVIALQSLHEVLNVRRRRGIDQPHTLDYVQWLSRACSVLSHPAEDLNSMLGLMSEHPALDAADAMIYASGIRAGVDAVVTRDRQFGLAVGEQWIDPSDPGSLGRLTATQ